MGLEVISFTIKEVRDKNDYIANMGRPDVARIKRDADVASAEANATRRSNGERIARSRHRQSAGRPGARAGGDPFQTKQAEAQRDLETKKALYWRP